MRKIYGVLDLEPNISAFRTTTKGASEATWTTYADRGKDILELVDEGDEPRVIDIDAADGHGSVLVQLTLGLVQHVHPRVRICGSHVGLYLWRSTLPVCTLGDALLDWARS